MGGVILRGRRMESEHGKGKGNSDGIKIQAWRGPGEGDRGGTGVPWKIQTKQSI